MPQEPGLRAARMFLRRQRDGDGRRHAAQLRGRNESLLCRTNWTGEQEEEEVREERKEKKKRELAEALRALSGGRCCYPSTYGKCVR